MSQRSAMTIPDEDAVSAAKFAGELKVSGRIHPDDFIYNFLVTNPVFETRDLAVRYYFFDGRDSAERLRGVLAGLGVNAAGPFSLLEFASGYGCVSRHMRNVFPQIDLSSCDIHPQAISFLQGDLGCRAVQSNSVPELLEVDRTFDVVFALSFFSHMPRTTWLRWLQTLYQRVKPGGHLIFTTQGLTTAKLYMGNPEIPADGFWFKAESEQKDLDTAEYGQTVVTEAFVNGQFRYLLGAKLVRYEPAFWWTHQDMWVVRRNM